MWKTLVDWAVAFLSMARELQENRSSIRNLEERVRNIEEALRILALEQKHARESQSAAHEKLVLVLENRLSEVRSLKQKRGSKK